VHQQNTHLIYSSSTIPVIKCLLSHLHRTSPFVDAPACCAAFGLKSSQCLQTSQGLVIMQESPKEGEVASPSMENDSHDTAKFCLCTPSIFAAISHPRCLPTMPVPIKLLFTARAIALGTMSLLCSLSNCYDISACICLIAS
jgi:hypothetical protein